MFWTGKNVVPNPALEFWKFSESIDLQQLIREKEKAWNKPDFYIKIHGLS